MEKQAKLGQEAINDAFVAITGAQAVGQGLRYSRFVVSAQCAVRVIVEAREYAVESLSSGGD